MTKKEWHALLCAIETSASEVRTYWHGQGEGPAHRTANIREEYWLKAADTGEIWAFVVPLVDRDQLAIFAPSGDWYFFCRDGVEKAEWTDAGLTIFEPYTDGSKTDWSFPVKRQKERAVLSR